MISSTRVRRITLRGDEGITLVELLVAIVLLAIASAMILNLFLSTTKAVGTSSSLTQNTRTAANIMDEISRVIRVGNLNLAPGNVTDPAVVVAKPESLTIIAYIDSRNLRDPEPVKVEFTVNAARQIVETRWPATRNAEKYWVFSATASSTRTLPGTIAIPSGANTLFTYYTPDSTADGLAEGKKIAFTNKTAGLDRSERLKIRSVHVNLVVLGAGDSASTAITVQNMVGIPNLNAVKP